MRAVCHAALISRIFLDFDVSSSNATSFARAKAVFEMAIEDAKTPATGQESYDSKSPHDAIATASSTSLSDEERLGLGQGTVPDDCAFDTTENPEIYRPISTYEGIHRWDPYFQWEESEEKSLIRKV